MKSSNSSKKRPSKIFIALLAVVIFLLIFLLINNYLRDQKEKAVERQKVEQAEPTVVSVSPRQVVESYMKATLGMLPGAEINYEKAKDYLEEKLKKKFTDISFVPLSYGIQDGPTDVKFVSEEITGNRAVVLVDAEWGGKFQRAWQFELVIVQGEWKISAIKRL